MSSLENSPSFEKQEDTFKIIVIGDSGVGKTCLFIRYFSGKFPKINSEATVGADFRKKTLNIDGEPIHLHIWDTAGQERHRRSMAPHYYRNVQGAVFVYDVTKTESFQNLNDWIEELSYYQKDLPDIPKILVGNKCDCLGQKAVSTKMAKTFASTHCMPLIEVSASDDSAADRVNEIFMTLARELKKRRKPAKPKPVSQSPSYPEEPPIKLTSSDYSRKNDNCCNC